MKKLSFFEIFILLAIIVVIGVTFCLIIKLM